MRFQILVILYIIILSCNTNPTTKKESREQTQTEIEFKDSMESEYYEEDSTLLTKSIDYTYNPANREYPMESPFDIYHNFESSFQKVTISNSLDTVIKFNKGTELTIRPNSFVIKGNPEEKISNLEVRIKEFYSASDFLLNNLSTMSDGRMLESGGSVYVEIRANGKECEIAKGKTLEISFPKSNEKEDMQLFEGNWNENAINWVEIGDRAQKEEMMEVFTVVENMPEFIGGVNILYEYIQRNIRYPANNRNREINGTIYVSFVVDEKGKTRYVEIKKGLDPILDVAAIEVIENMPLWIPGFHRGIPVSVAYILPIKIKWEEKKLGSSNAANLVDYKNYRDSVINSYADKRKFALVSSYVFPLDRLGWINCDRFLNFSPKTDLIAILENAEFVDAKLIFKGINSVLNGQSKDGNVYFNSIPKGRQVQLIATKKLNGEYYFATETFNTDKKFIDELNFNQIDISKLKKELEGVTF